MTVQIHFFLLNEHFSPEYAAANHQGEESENNLRYEWEDELEIKHVRRVQIHRFHDLPMSGLLPDDSPFSVIVPNMLSIEIESDQHEQAFLGVSESILNNFDETENGDTTIIKVYLKDYEPHANPMPGVYIASKEFPQELIV